MTEYIGLDIGSHSIKLVGLKMTSKGPFLAHLGMKEVPPGRDKEDVKTFSEVLRSLVKETGIGTKKVRMTISGSEIQIRRLTIPSLPGPEMKEAVRWEIKSGLPFPAETAQVDFHILNEFTEDHIKKTDLLVVAFPKHLFDRAVSIAEGAGLEPVHVDVAPFALWNTLVVWNQLKAGETVALVDLGAERTGVYLFKDEIFQFSREVAPGGAGITRAIMEGIGSGGDSGRLFEQAEKIKQEIGAPSGPDQEGISEKSGSLSKISFLMRPVLERLSAEVSRSFEYYKTLFNAVKIDRVLLTGGGANFKNIVPYLSNELRLPIEPFNPLSRILFDSAKIDARLFTQMGSTFTTAIGAALPKPERVELLPAKEAYFSKDQLIKSFPVLASGVVLLIFLGVGLTMNIKTSALKKELEVKKAEMSRLDALQGKLRLLKEKDIQIKGKLSQIPSSMIVPIPYRDILREVGQILPGNASLTHLSVHYKNKSSKGESPTDGGRELRLSGLTFGSDMDNLTALAVIIERLESMPIFKNVRLASADENKLYTQLGAHFEIFCDIHPNLPVKPTLMEGSTGGI